MSGGTKFWYLRQWLLLSKIPFSFSFFLFTHFITHHKINRFPTRNQLAIGHIACKTKNSGFLTTPRHAGLRTPGKSFGLFGMDVAGLGGGYLHLEHVFLFSFAMQDAGVSEYEKDSLDVSVDRCHLIGESIETRVRLWCRWAIINTHVFHIQALTREMLASRQRTARHDRASAGRPRCMFGGRVA